MTIQKIKSGRVNNVDADSFVGEKGTIFFNESLGDLRISDGLTVGGIPLSFGSGGSGNYVLPTASTSIKGGVKVDGTTIRISNQVISGFSGSYNDLSDKPTLFSGSYNSLTDRPTLFSGSYTDLTNKPTIPTNTNQLTNGAGFITSSALSGYATQSYVTNQGYITSAALSGYATQSYVTNQGYITSAALSGYALTSSVPRDISQLTDSQGLLGQGGGGTVIRNVENPFSFSVAGDDSTLREISNGESIKFTGAGGITVTSDSEGKITITGATVDLSNYVTLTGEQTLTNKTLTSPTINDPTFNGTFAFESNNTSQPAMTLTASNLSDGVGILRVIGSEPDINFNQVSESPGFNTFTFEWNGDPKLAMGRRNDHSFYITRNDGQWHDDAFVLNYSTGVLSVAEGISIPTIYFPDETTQTTAWTGSVDEIFKLDPTTTDPQDHYRAGVVTDLTNGVTVSTITGGPGFATTQSWNFTYDGFLRFPDDSLQRTAWTGSVNWANVTGKPSLAGTYSWSIAGDDSTLREVSAGESVKFIGAGGITTSSDAEGNITITGTPVNLTGYATESYVTSRGYITGLSWNQLTDKPNLAGTYTFNIAGTDSTLHQVNADNTIQFKGTGNISVTTDNDGIITIDLPSANVITSSTAPVNPRTGELWWDTISGNLYIYYDSTWVISNDYANITDYNQLTGLPDLSVYALRSEISQAEAYSFNITAGDSTVREITNNETIKIIGAGGITTSSDADGNITITGAAQDRLTSNTRSAILNTNGTFSLPTLTATPSSPQAGQMALADGVSWDPISQGGTSPYMVIYTGTAWIGLAGGVTMDQVYTAITEFGAAVL